MTPEQRHMQMFIRGEQAHSAALTRPAESHPIKTEMPMTAPDDHVEAMQHMPPSHSAFQAPQNMWDATREAPPSSSKPEAGSFPSEHYSMSQDTHLYQPPTNYASTERLAPIFPWESKASKPTRVFAETPAPPTTAAGGADTEIPSPGPAENIKVQNAWDADHSIDAYVRAVRGSQRGISADFAESEIKPRLKKPGSLVLTDFPTAVERPSLPVTPAPIQRPMFWGNADEQAELGKTLPSAEGVPEQKDWNPSERLEELRRSSLITAAELPNVAPGDDTLPRREVVQSSQGVASGSDLRATVPSLEAQSVELGTEPGEAVVTESSEAGHGLISGGLSVGSFGNTGFSTVSSTSSSSRTFSSSSETFSSSSVTSEETVRPGVGSGSGS